MKSNDDPKNLRAAPGSDTVKPAQGLNDLLSSAPGVHFVVMRHEPWCPGVHGDGANCVCNPVPELVDKDTWIRSYADTGKRAAVRAAARESDKGTP